MKLSREFDVDRWCRGQVGYHTALVCSETLNKGAVVVYN